MSEHTIQCWSCGTGATLNEIRTEDGYCPECEVEIDLAEYYPKLAEAHDALHAEADALRDENGRLSEELDKTELRALKFIHQCNAHVDLYRELKAERDQLSTELEAARGLLVAYLQKLLPELDDALEDLELHGYHDQQGYRKLKDWFRKVQIQTRKLDSALTATTAPEVRQDCELCAGAGHDHFVDKCAHCDTLAEQLERQEAVAVKSHGAWDGLDDLDNLPDGTMLYTTPQPGPDVRGLVEALEWYEQKAAGCRKLTSEGDECRQTLDSDGGKRAQTALAAHRQAQQGGSHD